MATGIDTPGLCAVLAALALLAAPAAPLTAQEELAARSWSLGIWAAGGYQWTAGRLANNAASDNPNLQLLETVSNLGPSPAMAVGVELRLPQREVAVRMGLEATSGAEATGQVAICDLVSGGICVPEVAPVRIRAVTTTARLLTGNPLSSVRPILVGGLGVRTFDFDIPGCPPVSSTERSLICRATTDLFRDASPHYFLRFGAGLQADTDRISLALEALGSTGRYTGGAGRTDGNWYHDLRIAVSTSIPLI